MSLLAQENSITSHAVLLPMPLKGHWPTVVSFVIKLIKRSPKTACTILVAGDWLERTSHAFDRAFADENAGLRNNIRIIQLGGQGMEFEALVPTIFENFAPYYTSLTTSSDIVCKSGKVHPGIRPPDVLIIDTFYYGVIHISRSITQRKIPIYGWLTVQTAGTLRFVIEGTGLYLGNVAEEAPVIAKKLNKTVGEVTYEIYHPTKGTVVNLPGHPAVFDYEFHTEQLPLSIALPHMELWNSLCRLLHECDGMLAVSDPAVEPEANEAFRAWFAKTNRSFYALGPLLLEGPEIPHPEISDFLSRMLQSYGEHSVLYFSFGTFFTPQGTAYVKIMEVILDMNIPLVFSFASGAKFPPEIVERMNKSDKVYTSPWIPQKLVLSHSATGFFLTHCGQNSFTEAIEAGVPMIGYPVAVDQPVTAACLSEKLKIGYELIETRLGTALRPAYRGANPTGTPAAIEREIRDVLGKAFGHDGEEKRRNIRLLREKSRESWSEGGASSRNLDKFIEEVFSRNEAEK